MLEVLIKFALPDLSDQQVKGIIDGRCKTANSQHKSTLDSENADLAGKVLDKD